MRAMLPTRRFPKLKPPPGDDGSLSFTPSMSATVWSLSAPRMNTDVVVPMPPLRVKVMPGTLRNRSTTVSLWRRRIASASMTETDCPTSDSGCSVRVAVMTTASSATAGSRCENENGNRRETSAEAHASPWTRPEHEGSRMQIFETPRARPQPVVTRGKTSIARHTPSAQRTDCDRQVSWLPGQRVRPAFPDAISSGGVIGRMLSGHSCGGSPGSWTRGPLPGSLLIPVSGNLSRTQP